MGMQIGANCCITCKCFMSILQSSPSRSFYMATCLAVKVTLDIFKAISLN